MSAEYDPEIPEKAHLHRIAREMSQVRQLLAQLVNALMAAESEVPEKIRRFANYAHDVHDIKYMYEEHGMPPPKWIKEEIERCDDRWRQLLDDLHTDGGTFEQVRRQMTERGGNRYDHTRQLKGPSNEAGQSEPQCNGRDEEQPHTQAG